jgi:Ran GTPase-activating protein (RanGAP) involved in mRNA processing and transport
MNLSNLSVSKIALFMKSAVTLKRLDISKNALLPDAFEELLEELSTNRTLTSLSLSDNLLINQKDQKERGEVAHLFLARNTKFKPIRDYIELYYAELRKKVRNHDAKELQSEKVVRCFGNFIRKNKKLLYLDLDSTGLSHKVMVDLVPQLQRAKGLLSVHFGFNPGIDD